MYPKLAVIALAYACGVHGCSVSYLIFQRYYQLLISFIFMRHFPFRLFTLDIKCTLSILFLPFLIIFLFVILYTFICYFHKKKIVFSFHYFDHI